MTPETAPPPSCHADPAEQAARQALLAIPGLTWRRPTRADLPAVQACYAASEAHDDSSEHTALAGLEDYWDSPRSVPQEDLLLGLEGDEVVAVGWAGCDRSGTEARRVHLGGTVHPRWRRRGVGTALLAWQLAHGRAWAATCEQGRGPLVMRAFAGADQEDLARVADAADLHPVRWFVEMARPIDGPVPARAVPGVRLLDWDPARAEEARLVVDAAFRDHWGYTGTSPQMWRDQLAATEFRARWSVLAQDEETGRLVGVALGAAYEQDWEIRGFTEGCTDELAVLRSHRGRGVASALLAESVRRFAADGMASAALGVDVANPSGALRLYESLGYRPTARTVAYEWQPGA